MKTLTKAALVAATLSLAATPVVTAADAAPVAGKKCTKAQAKKTPKKCKKAPGQVGAPKKR